MSLRKLLGTMVCALLLSVPSFSQEDSTLVAYAIHFTDKANSPYNLSTPEEFLSEKALERRANQGIGLKTNDLPVTMQYQKEVQSKAEVFHFATKWFNAAIVSLKDSSQLMTIRNLAFVDTCIRIRGLDLQPNGKGELIDNFPDLPLSYGKSYRQLAMMNGHLLHNNDFQGQNQMIAVLDAGFRHVRELDIFEHLLLYDLIRGTRNFYEPTDYVYSFSNHGMHVLSLMGGYLKGGFIGSAPLASYLLLRSEFTGSEFPIEEYAWVAAAEYADSAGAKIINSSLGYKTFDDSTLNYQYDDMNGRTTTVSKGASIAANKGMLVVSSAGNEGNDAWQYITAPGDADSILTVGAVDSTGHYADFSSTGPSADGRIKPDVSAMGARTYVSGTANYELLQGNGTSFSAPLISGLAACLWQAYPSAINMKIREAIIRSATQFQNPDTLIGHGIPDFYEASKYLDEEINGNFPLSELITLYPNPIKDFAKVKFYSNRAQALTLKLINTNGQTIRSRQHQLPANQTFTFELTNLEKVPSGLYILKLSNEAEQFTRKIIIE